jgi:uncharacterized membrane protein YdfJ with MMPL/SSD domain
MAILGYAWCVMKSSRNMLAIGAVSAAVVMALVFRTPINVALAAGLLGYGVVLSLVALALHEYGMANRR